VVPRYTYLIYTHMYIQTISASSSVPDCAVFLARVLSFLSSRLKIYFACLSNPLNVDRSWCTKDNIFQSAWQGSHQRYMRQFFFKRIAHEVLRLGWSLTRRRVWPIDSQKVNVSVTIVLLRRSRRLVYAYWCVHISGFFFLVFWNVWRRVEFEWCSE
jgi:hypothetical protein